MRLEPRMELVPLKVDEEHFPGGPVVENPPVNAGDRSLVWEGSTCCRATKPVSMTTEPMHHDKCSHYSEKPARLH